MGLRELLSFLSGEQAFGLVHDRRGETLSLGATLAGQEKDAIFPLHGCGQVRPGKLLGGARKVKHLFQFDDGIDRWWHGCRGRLGWRRGEKVGLLGGESGHGGSLAVRAAGRHGRGYSRQVAKRSRRRPGWRVPRQNILSDYLSEIARIRATRADTGEISYYGALTGALNAAGELVKPRVFCVPNLSGKGAGFPDMGLFIAARGLPKDD